jgi:hypothetical protein
MHEYRMTVTRPLGVDVMRPMAFALLIWACLVFSSNREGE